jgi:hypothetical protein
MMYICGSCKKRSIDDDSMRSFVERFDEFGYLKISKTWKCECMKEKKVKEVQKDEEYYICPCTRCTSGQVQTPNLFRKRYQHLLLQENQSNLDKETAAQLLQRVLESIHSGFERKESEDSRSETYLADRGDSMQKFCNGLLKFMIGLKKLMDIPALNTINQNERIQEILRIILGKLQEYIPRYCRQKRGRVLITDTMQKTIITINKFLQVLQH